MDARRERPTVLEWLFPNWSSPAVLAGGVALRFLLNGGLTLLVARATGRSSLATVAAGTVTVAGAGVAVLVFRDVLGHSASLVDLLAQLALVGLAGYATYRHSSPGRALAYAVLALGTLTVGLYTVPLYGEATVAP